jgi:hypothetical protein
MTLYLLTQDQNVLFLGLPSKYGINWTANDLLNTILDL